MRLVNSEYNIDIDITEDNIFVLIIENPHVFGKMAEELWRASNGELSSWILSEREKTVSMAKIMDVIFNPYAVDLNDRKVITKLYSELSDIGFEKHHDEIGLVNSDILSLLSKVIQEVPYYIVFNTEIDFPSLLKLYNVKIASEEESVLELVIDYIRIFHKVCNVSVFVFINLKNYFDKAELEQLYEFILYEKVYVLLLEAHQSEILSKEKTLILDKDLCIINL